MANRSSAILKRDIAAWDGKCARDIEDVYNDHGDESSFVTDLIGFAELPDLEVGATWLLKKHREVEGLAPDVADRIYGLVPHLGHWAARLHVLQLMPYLAVPKRRAEEVAAFIREGLRSKQAVVRAWAYGGLYELAMQFPEYVAEARPLLEKARRDEAASVKARLRNAMTEEL